jgi:hypothetical protein
VRRCAPETAAKRRNELQGAKVAFLRGGTVAGKAATPEAAARGVGIEVMYQLSWETAPGLAGLRCEGFRAIPTSRPDTTRGVAAACGSEEEAERLARALEEHFAGKRFSNDAAAFEAVKAFVGEWGGERRD